jgi:hypothetical protein
MSTPSERSFCCCYRLFLHFLRIRLSNTSANTIPNTVDAKGNRKCTNKSSNIILNTSLLTHISPEGEQAINPIISGLNMIAK